MHKTVDEWEADVERLTADLDAAKRRRAWDAMRFYEAKLSDAKRALKLARSATYGK